MESIMLEMAGVSKKFAPSSKWSMIYGVTDLAADLFGFSRRTNVLRRGEFWAVNDISFQVKKGQSIGLIGPNGAGKSTVLRLASGIILPDKGSIRTSDKIGSLISVGAGFHPMLTGRENVYIQGAIQGMTKKEIASRLDEIVEFADIKEFIDTPIKYYSSGMFVRLGFSIATAIKPELLLIDEILAVGDKMFQVKCFNKISELKKECAVLFVSHNMSAVARLCDTTIVCDKGRKIFQGPTGDAIDVYNKLFMPNLSQFMEESDGFKLLSIKIDSNVVSWGGRTAITAEFNSLTSSLANRVRIVFMDTTGIPVAEWVSTNRGLSYNIDKGRNTIRAELDNIKLRTGKYFLSFILSPSDSEKYLICAHACHSIEVKDRLHGFAPYQL